jgi:hypothetical protein
MKYTFIIRRCAAYLIDCALIYLFFVFIAQTLLFVPLRSLLFGADDWFRLGWYAEFYSLLTISAPTWLYFTLCEISPWQTIAEKKLLKLKTFDVDNRRRLTFRRAFLRTIVKPLPWEIAHLTNNLPTPMWYDQNPGFRFGFVLVPILIMVYLLLVLVSNKRQGPHDLVANSVVYVG